MHVTIPLVMQQGVHFCHEEAMHIVIYVYKIELNERFLLVLYF